MVYVWKFCSVPTQIVHSCEIPNNFFKFLLSIMMEHVKLFLYVKFLQTERIQEIMEQTREIDEIDEEVEGDVGELLRLLWSHILEIVAAGVAAAIICLLVCTFALTPRYQASINLIVNSRQDGQATVTNDNINSAKNLISTYAVVIKSNTVLNDVIKKLDLDMTYNELSSMVDVSSVNSTQIMSITVTNEDAKLAGKIAETIADIAPEVIVDKVEAGSCKTVSDVEIGTDPIFPQTKKYTALAAVAGIVIVCAILVINHLLRNYIVDDEDVQKKLGLPVLGLIPEV